MLMILIKYLFCKLGLLNLVLRMFNIGSIIISVHRYFCEKCSPLMDNLIQFKKMLTIFINYDFPLINTKCLRGDEGQT